MTSFFIGTIKSFIFSAILYDFKKVAVIAINGRTYKRPYSSYREVLLLKFVNMSVNVNSFTDTPLWFIIIIQRFNLTRITTSIIANP